MLTNKETDDRFARISEQANRAWDSWDFKPHQADHNLDILDCDNIRTELLELQREINRLLAEMPPF